MHVQQDAQDFFNVLLENIHSECMVMASIWYVFVCNEFFTFFLLTVLNLGDQDRAATSTQELEMKVVQPYIFDCWKRSSKSKFSEVFGIQNVRLSKCTKAGCTFQSAACVNAMYINLLLPCEKECNLKVYFLVLLSNLVLCGIFVMPIGAGCIDLLSWFYLFAEVLYRTVQRRCVR